MKRHQFPVVFVTFGVFMSCGLLLGCGGTDDNLGELPGNRGGSSGDDVAGGGGQASIGGGQTSGGGGVSVGGWENGGSSAGGTTAEEFTPWGMCAVSEEAGSPVFDAAFVGRGACFETTLAEMIAQAQDAYPDLASVTTLYGASGDSASSSELIYAFEKPNGAFQLAFFQGSGDCPAGCIDSAWTYIEMNENCEPERAGSFSAIYSGESNCREVAGSPLWGMPAARPSNHDCGLEDKYADFAGTFEVPFSGTRTPCSDKGGDASQEVVSGTLTMAIEQDAEDPSLGNVTFSGEDLDSEWLGSDPFDVHFEYFQAEVNSQWDNLPAMCMESREVRMVLDFEGCSESGLSMFEVRDLECGGDYCKGSLDLKLDLSAIRLELRD